MVKVYCLCGEVIRRTTESIKNKEIEVCEKCQKDGGYDIDY